jgi:hypothetical protein
MLFGYLHLLFPDFGEFRLSIVARDEAVVRGNIVSAEHVACSYRVRAHCFSSASWYRDRVVMP